MNRKITFDLSESSIKEAKAQLDSYRLSMSPAFSQAMNALMYDAADYLERILQIEQVPEDQRIKIAASPTKGGFILNITGNGVGFVEFGAGVYADDNHPFVGEAPFPVFSGSWSDEHEGTYQAWKETGAYSDSKGDYLYNLYPVRPLYETSVWIKENYAKYFKEAFERIRI